MTNNYKILSWDSDFFGFLVVKIIPNKLNLKELEKILTDLKERNVSLVYFASDSEHEDSLTDAKSLGGFLTGQKITYILNLETIPISIQLSTVPLEEYGENKPNKDLVNLILQGGIYSRFYVDPKISRKQYESLHKLWLANSIKNNTLFVMKKNNTIVGFVSLNEKNKRGNIDFIVVDKSFRGRGFGSALLSQTHRWFVSKGYDAVQAVAQKENVIACKMYEKCGYKVEKIEKFYHFWL